MIVALLNQKGGVGKTTLALHLAGAWARQGRRVTLIDADPQSSALDWSEQRSARRTSGSRSASSASRATRFTVKRPRSPAASIMSSSTGPASPP